MHEANTLDFDVDVVLVLRKYGNYEFHLDDLIRGIFLRLLRHRFLRFLAVRFSSSCAFLRLDFQLLAF